MIKICSCLCLCRAQKFCLLGIRVACSLPSSMERCVLLLYFWCELEERNHTSRCTPLCRGAVWHRARSEKSAWEPCKSVTNSSVQIQQCCVRACNKVVRNAKEPCEIRPSHVCFSKELCESINQKFVNAGKGAMCSVKELYDQRDVCISQELCESIRKGCVQCKSAVWKQGKDFCAIAIPSSPSMRSSFPSFTASLPSHRSPHPFLHSVSPSSLPPPFLFPSYRFPLPSFCIIFLCGHALVVSADFLSPCAPAKKTFGNSWFWSIHTLGTVHDWIKDAQCSSLRCLPWSWCSGRQEDSGAAPARGPCCLIFVSPSLCVVSF